jgi:hypothetical protein
VTANTTSHEGGGDLTGLLGLIAHDAEHLVDQHFELLRAELRQGLRELPPAAVSLATGAGLVTTAGLMGSLMLVHGLHRATRLPLWGCYGLVGGLMATAGGALLTTGLRRAGNLRVTPHETIAALREDVQWLRDQITNTDTRPAS